ncbi:hypothetical protein ACSAZL_15085 [Methanosarcina sp. T3]|uniref:hypothetical protein n=1 Tax=Methanosarcina sp. T3 TaxID=3439062 RepID=UPI003F847652
MEKAIEALNSLLSLQGSKKASSKHPVFVRWFNEEAILPPALTQIGSGEYKIFLKKNIYKHIKFEGIPLKPDILEILPPPSILLLILLLVIFAF